jgi:hypothetical protein
MAAKPLYICALLILSIIIRDYPITAGIRRARGIRTPDFPFEKRALYPSELAPQRDPAL